MLAHNISFGRVGGILRERVFDAVTYVEIVERCCGFYLITLRGSKSLLNLLMERCEPQGNGFDLNMRLDRSVDRIMNLPCSFDKAPGELSELYDGCSEAQG